MGKEYMAVGEGLRQVLWGELLAVISLVTSDVGRGLQVMPLVWLGGLVGIVSMVMVISGLAGASAVQAGYKKALLCVVAELLLSIATGFMPDFGKAIFTVLTALLASTGVWFVCGNTCEVLTEQEEGEERWIHQSNIVSKLYAVGSVLAAAAYALFIYTHWIPAASFPVMLAAPILQIAVLFAYLHFLDKCQRLLRRK